MPRDKATSVSLLPPFCETCSDCVYGLPMPQFTQLTVVDNRVPPAEWPKWHKACGIHHQDLSATHSFTVPAAAAHSALFHSTLLSPETGCHRSPGRSTQSHTDLEAQLAGPVLGSWCQPRCSPHHCSDASWAHPAPKGLEALAFVPVTAEGSGRSLAVPGVSQECWIPGSVPSLARPP